MCHYESFRDAESAEELECRRRLEGYLKPDYFLLDMPHLDESKSFWYWMNESGVIHKNTLPQLLERMSNNDYDKIPIYDSAGVVEDTPSNIRWFAQFISIGSGKLVEYEFLLKFLLPHINRHINRRIRMLEDEIDKTRKSGRVEQYPDFKRHRLDNLYERQIHYLELSMKFDKRI